MAITKKTSEDTSPKTKLVPVGKIPEEIREYIIKIDGEDALLELTHDQLKRLDQKNRRFKLGVQAGIIQICKPSCESYDQCPLVIIGRPPLTYDCLTSSSMVLREDGLYISIKDVKVGEKILSFNTSTMKSEFRKVLASKKKGIKKVYKITTKKGYSIECTSNHPLYTTVGRPHRRNSSRKEYIRDSRSVDSLPHIWQSIDGGFEKGSLIAMNTYNISKHHDLLEEGLPEIIGYFLTDGNSNKYQGAFNNTNARYIREFAKLCRNVGSYPKIGRRQGGIVNGSNKKDSADVHINPENNIRLARNPLRDKLVELGLWNVKGPNKQIPDILFSTSRKQIGLFLNRLWAGDGWITISKDSRSKKDIACIGIMQESRKLIDQLRLLLLSYGIRSTINTRKAIKRVGELNYTLYINSKYDMEQFLDLTGPIFGKEKAYNRAREIIATIGDRLIHREGDIIWEWVKDIKPSEDKMTYDIEIESNHNFFANGLLVHNCPIELDLYETSVFEYREAIFQRVRKQEGIDTIDDIAKDRVMSGMIAELTEAELIEFRANAMIATLGIVTEVPVLSATEFSEVEYRIDESVSLKIKRDMKRRRDGLLKQLLATPEMIEKTKGKSKGVDPLKRINDTRDRVREAIDRAGNVIVEAEILDEEITSPKNKTKTNGSTR